MIHTSMKQYCILTSSEHYVDLVSWAKGKGLRLEIHLNRTRFWVPAGPLHTEYVLRWYHCTSQVQDNEDLATGQEIL